MQTKEKFKNYEWEKYIPETIMKSNKLIPLFKFPVYLFSA